MNKKGEWSLLQTMTVVGGIVAAFVLLSIVLRISSSDRVSQAFYTEDTALLLDTVIGSPQDVRMSYSGNGYVVIQDNSVSYSPNMQQGDFIGRLVMNDARIKNGILWSDPFYIIKDNRTVDFSTDQVVVQE